MIARIALLAGLFGVPLLLLFSAHRIRDLTPRAKSRFWGGIIGYVGGLSFAVLSMMTPPVLWVETVRAAAVHWAMLVGFAVGVTAGPYVLRNTNQNG